MFLYVRENYGKLIENGFLVKCDLIKIFLSMYIPFRPNFWKIVKSEYTVASIVRNAYKVYSVDHKIQTYSELPMEIKLDTGEICCNPFRSMLFKLIICGVIIFISLVFSSISLSSAIRKYLRKALLFAQIFFLFFFLFLAHGIYLSMISKSCVMDNMDSFPPMFCHWCFIP